MIAVEFDPITRQVLRQFTVDGPYSGLIVGSITRGECYVSNDMQVIPVPPQPSPSHTWNWSTKQWAYDLSEGRAQAWARIKSARESMEFGPFVWGVHTFDGDEVSRSRLGIALEGAKEAIAAGDTAWSKPWKLANNAVITLSAPDLVEVVRAHGENMEAAHATAGVLAYFIDAATTPEELEAIQWPA